MSATTCSWRERGLCRSGPPTSRRRTLSISIPCPSRWTTRLAPLNRLWARFGAVLHDIVNPVIMGLLFVTSIVPIGLLMRLLGKDFLRLRRDPSAATYWIPCGAAERPDAMKDQF